MEDMKYGLFFDSVWGQFLIFPTIGITYDITLNGNYELYFKWLGFITGISYGYGRIELEELEEL